MMKAAFGMPIEWHPITGCSPISPGCANCYAMKLAGGSLKDDPLRAGLTVISHQGPIWNGQLRFNSDVLNQPRLLAGARLVYVCPHGDLFHENAPDQWIERVFAVMEDCRMHVFQVLTKRAERMEQFINSRFHSAPAHIHFGVSAERQIEAEERIPRLLALRAPVRYITFFPLLGPIRVAPFLSSSSLKIAYVNAGQETERPMHPEWETALKADCEAAGVAYKYGPRLE